jgi:hypothetical protein
MAAARPGGIGMFRHLVMVTLFGWFAQHGVEREQGP